MNKTLLAMLAGTGMLSAAMAQTTIIDTDSAGYVEGDLAGQGWTAATNGWGAGTNAFNVLSTGEIDSLSTSRTNAQNRFIALDTAPAGNGDDAEWNGVMEYSITHSSNYWRHGSIYEIGISANPTNILHPESSNDVILAVGGWYGTGGTENQTYNIDAIDSNGDWKNILTILAGDAGISTNDATGQLESGDFTLNWNMRRTRDVGYYALTASLAVENTNIVGNTVYVYAPNVYSNTAPTYKMGIDGNATFMVGGVYPYRRDITIDRLKLEETVGTGPNQLVPTTVTTVNGDGSVALAWDRVVEAEFYRVLRSADGIDGTYDEIDNSITTEGYVDNNNLDNGSTYYYIIEANATGLTPASSAPAEARPNAAISNGTVIDTSFAASEQPPYTTGDLAGQNLWLDMTTNTSGFVVNPNGNGIVDMSSSTNLVFSNTSNQGYETIAVYNNNVTSNNVNDRWTGKLDFSLVAPAIGSATNIIETAPGVSEEYIYDVALMGLGGQPIFSFGLTYGFSTEMSLSSNALILVRSNSGNLSFSIGDNKEDPLLTLTTDDLGWDPTWSDKTNTNGPILETEMISLDYSLRKMSAPGGYMAKLSAKIGENTFQGEWKRCNLNLYWQKPTPTYDAEVVSFYMGSKSSATNDQHTVASKVYPMVDSVSMSHSSTNDMVKLDPFKLKASNEDLAIKLEWEATSEELQYHIYRSNTQGIFESTPLISIPATTGAQEYQYIDTGLDESKTYFYKITSEFIDGTETEGTQTQLRAITSSDFLAFYTEYAFSSNGNKDLSYGTDLVKTDNGTYAFITGMGVDGSCFGDELAANIDQTKVDLLRLIAQSKTGTDTDDWISIRKDSNMLIARIEGAVLMYCEAGTPYDAHANPLRFEAQPELKALPHVAIRNKGKWLASDTITVGGTYIALDLKTIEFAPLNVADASSTNLMAVGTNFVMGSELDLSAVDAVGLFYSNTEWAWCRGFRAIQATPITPYDNWCDNSGVYNDSAAKIQDPDQDGVDNWTEYAFDGNPTNAADVGILGRHAAGQNANGDLLYVYPQRKNAPDIKYNVIETDNLVHNSGWAAANATPVGTSSTWPGHGAMQAVTNAIPTTEATKFLKVEAAQ